MPFTLTVTNAGRAALVNAARDGTNAVRIASVGVSAAAWGLSATSISMPAEIKRITTIAGDAVAADTIHVTVRDESSAAYTVRSLALYLADGTLFAAYTQAAPLVEKSAQAMLLLALDVRFADIAATSLTFGATDFLNPPATTEMQGVVELATDAEANAGTDDRRAVTPRGLSFALSARLSSWGSDIWRASNDGAGSGLDADLLDGQQGSFYTNIPARLGFWPVRQGTGAGQLPNTIHIGWSGTRLKATVDTTDIGNIVFDQHIADVWRASNDGAGSGLDADLLDGQDSSFYINIPARLGYTPANRAGDTFTGNIALAGAGSNIFYFESVAGAFSFLRFQRSGRVRWDVGMNASAEAGGATGSDFFINRFDDAGNVIDTPFLMYRATGELRLQGGRAWHSGNDGAGSGLDADLLDGQDSSFYTNITARLGYTPANRSGDTLGRMTFASGATGNNGIGTVTPFLGEVEIKGNGTGAAMLSFHRTGAFATYLGLDTDNALKIGGWSHGANAYTIWHAGNDGSGSGLDADALDGQDGSFYTNIPARLGFWPVRQGTGAGQLPNTIHIGWSGTRLKATVDASDIGNIVFDQNIADVWRASNDGAGSGLDADLLDGRQASDFVLQNDGARFGSNANGYWERRPNGVIEQWGTINGPFTEGQQFVTFPIPFTNADSVNISATGVNNFANNRFDITIQRVSRSAEGCSLMVQYTAASTSINQIDAIDWRAVGI
ncbi:gp53-like domain-containing protein [Sphingomonas elodea]|uniref:gp53-like domain-containing protein n=1 Tax=Sphingomonas elodea TaxID=179878 RepID=UPI000263171D|nr:hypothetical protein [Sphingomonas elodea]